MEYLMIILIVLLSFCYINPNFSIGEVNLCGSTHNTLIVLILIIALWLVGRMDEKENFYYHSKTFCPDKTKHCASRKQTGEMCRNNDDCASSRCIVSHPIKMDIDGNSLGICYGM